MINKIEEEVDNKERRYTKSRNNGRNFTCLSKCHEIRINKPVNERKTKDKGDIGTERAVSAVRIEEGNGR